MPYTTVQPHTPSTTAGLLNHAFSSTANDILLNAHEFIKDKLYFTSLSQPPHHYPNVHFFTIDNVLVYLPFYLDFGPSNMAHTVRFCEMMQEKFRSPSLKQKKICLYSSMDSDKRANAAYLMCAYMMIVQKCTPTTAFAPLSTCTPPLLPFRDAGYGPATYHITIPDILAGLYKALHLGIIDIDGVDAEEYEYFEKVENGDLNWVTARFIALACPREDIKGGSGSVGATMYQQQIQVQQQQQQQLTQYTTTTSLFSRIVASTTSSSPAPPPSSSTHMSRGGRVPLTPAYRMDDLIKHLKGKGVTTIVRLNNKTYDKSKFIDAGLEHVDLYFPDGTTPPDGILKRFLDLCEAPGRGVIAVHCKAGLGRTGTLIAAYLMKHYRFSAAEVIGLLRVLRPGSVVGPQQNYLQSMQAKLWRLHPTTQLPPSISLLFTPPTFPTSKRFPAAEMYIASTTTNNTVSTMNTHQPVSKSFEEISDSMNHYNHQKQQRIYSGTGVGHGGGRGAWPVSANPGMSIVSTRRIESSLDPSESSVGVAAATAALNIAATDYEGAGIGSHAVSADGVPIPIQPRKHSSLTPGSDIPTRVTTTTTTTSHSSISTAGRINNSSNNPLGGHGGGGNTDVMSIGTQTQSQAQTRYNLRMASRPSMISSRSNSRSSSFNSNNSSNGGSSSSNSRTTAHGEFVVALASSDIERQRPQQQHQQQQQQSAAAAGQVSRRFAGMDGFVLTGVSNMTSNGSSNGSKGISSSLTNSLNNSQ